MQFSKHGYSSRSWFQNVVSPLLRVGFPVMELMYANYRFVSVLFENNRVSISIGQLKKNQKRPQDNMSHCKIKNGFQSEKTRFLCKNTQK